MTDQFDKAFRGAAQSTDELTERLYVLQGQQWGNESAMDANVEALQALTGVAGTAMMGLQEFGYVNDEQAESFRKAETAIQMLLIPYELYNIVKTYMIAAETAHIKSLMAETAATQGATVATWSFTGALLANPLVLIVVAAVLLAAALVALELKFGLVTKGIDASKEAFQNLRDMINGVTASIFGLGDAAKDLVEGGLEKLHLMGDLIGGGGGMGGMA